MKQVSFLLIVVTLHICYSNNFVIHPQPVNATTGSQVSFHCLSDSGLRPTWYINGTSLSQLPHSQLVTVSTGSFISEGSRIFFLRFVAQPVFNNSLIVCQANSLFSNSAFLQVQGKLDAVKDLTALVAGNFTVFITWLAPFSLDITPTDTETGIMSYCVEVYKGTQMLVVSACELVATHYTYHPVVPSPCDIVEILVIPTNDAGNGSSSHLARALYNGPGCFTVSSNITITFISNENLLVQVTNISQLDITCSCSICITNAISDSEDCHDAFCNNNQLLFYTSGIIERREIFTFTITLENAGGSSTSDKISLSTYDLQQITVTPLITSGTVEVHLRYITNSSSSGCFVIFVQDQYTGYFAIKKLVDRERQSVELEGLPEGEYTIGGYEVGDGSHFYDPMEAAVVSYNVTVEHGAAFWNQVVTSSSISVHLNGNDALCTVCHFSTTSTSLGCVVLIHPQNNFSRITVKEIGSHTAQPLCVAIQGDKHYTVAVFEWKSDGFVGLKPVSVSEINISGDKNDQKSSPSFDIALVSSLAVALPALLGCLIIASCAIMFKYLKSTREGRAKEPEVIYSEPSMARDELVADDIAMKGNQAYATPPKTLQDSPSPVYEFIN